MPSIASVHEVFEHFCGELDQLVADLPVPLLYLFWVFDQLELAGLQFVQFLLTTFFLAALLVFLLLLLLALPELL